MLTLAAGQGALWVLVGAARIWGVEKSGMGRRFQRHGPVHVVIVGPDEPDLVERQHGDLLEVQLMSGLHGGDPGRVAPGARAGRSRLSRHIRQTCNHKKTTLARLGVGVASLSHDPLTSDLRDQLSLGGFLISTSVF